MTSVIVANLHLEARGETQPDGRADSSLPVGSGSRPSPGAAARWPARPDCRCMHAAIVDRPSVCDLEISHGQLAVFHAWRFAITGLSTAWPAA